MPLLSATLTQATMTVRKKLTVALIGVLYLVTWVGGWIQHSHDLERATWSNYRAIEKLNTERIEYAKESRTEPFLVKLFEGGPVARVNWCIPLLPGVLLADSDSVPGPLGGYGGPKFVLYYGFGSTELFWFGWIS
jgi:hypothetical protein